MITKNQAIEIVKKYISELDNIDEKNKCKEILEKINSISDEEFSKLACNTLGENSGMSEFNNWLNLKIQNRNLQGTKFVPLNEMVSYNIAGVSKETIALHVVPTHLTTQQIRNIGAYIVDALEQIKNKIKDGEFENIKSIYAVSDILKLKILQGYFRDLGFNVSKGEEAFKRHFKEPYQASLNVKALLSDEWEELKEKFMKDKMPIGKLRNNNDKEEKGE